MCFIINPFENSSFISTLFFQISMSVHRYQVSAAMVSVEILLAVLHVPVIQALLSMLEASIVQVMQCEKAVK